MERGRESNDNKGFDLPKTPIQRRELMGNHADHRENHGDFQTRSSRTPNGSRQSLGR